MTKFKFANYFFKRDLLIDLEFSNPDLDNPQENYSLIARFTVADEDGNFQDLEQYQEEFETREARDIRFVSLYPILETNRQEIEEIEKDLINDTN